MSKKQGGAAATRIRSTSGDRLFYIILYILITIFMLIVFVPLVHVVAASFSSRDAVSGAKVWLWPVDFSIEGYQAVFKDKDIWRAYGNTIYYTIAGTAINIVMTMIAAYPLARRGLRFKGFFMFLFTFTMMFSGGLIPGYILLKNLRMLNTRWALLLPGAISVYNLILARTFIMNIPYDLYEAATIDGCSDFRYFITMVLPLSATLLSVLTLYYAVGHWNSYQAAFLYLTDQNLMPLQVKLRSILIQNTIDMEQIVDDETLTAKQGLADLLKYSLIIVSNVPMLILYPFIKRFFLKGVMLGSLKG